jgi:hypothetical protein
MRFWGEFPRVEKWIRKCPPIHLPVPRPQRAAVPAIILRYVLGLPNHPDTSLA